jgi:hypothetical protein
MGGLQFRLCGSAQLAMRASLERAVRSITKTGKEVIAGILEALAHFGTLIAE